MSREIITIADVREAGYCVKGAREWFRLKGLDFKGFLANGIAVETVAAMDDAMVQHILKIKRENNGR